MAAVIFLIWCIVSCALCWILTKGFSKRPKISNVKDKFVLITGCDSGFGKETATRLETIGFNVIACCLTKEGQHDLLKNSKGRITPVCMNVTKSEEIKQVYEQVKGIIPKDLGLWAIINNAGIMTLAPLEWVSMEEFKYIADVNLWGVIEVTKTFLPLLKKGKGRVVNMSSLAGLYCASGRAPYCISKYGIEAFSDALRREMKSFGVKVSIIEPPAFNTLLWKDLATKKLTTLWNNLTDEMRCEYGLEYFERFQKSLQTYTKRSDTNLVTDAYIDAVISQNPYPRYPIGRGVVKNLVIAILPTFLQDYFIQ
ncbi:Retinol dehydrogenase 7 [Exaiptasia diaphana]|nr:Retinol dehydrogenase 7 [Exaiptasia diaphana]